MSTETHRKLVLRACEYLSERNVPALMDLMHEHGTWSIPYRSDMFQYAGKNGKKAQTELLTQFLAEFTDFSFTVTDVTAENDRVAIEAKSVGKGPGTAHYENIYNIIFIIKDEKLHTIREYLDPFQVLSYVAQLSA